MNIGKELFASLRALFACGIIVGVLLVLLAYGFWWLLS